MVPGSMLFKHCTQGDNPSEDTANQHKYSILQTRVLCLVTQLTGPLHISMVVLSKGAEGCKPVESLGRNSLCLGESFKKRVGVE